MQIATQPPLALYTQTAAGRYTALPESPPGDIPGLASIVHGLLIHEHMAPGYGVTLTEEDRSSVHLRPVEQLLAHVLARDSRPLHVARPPVARVPPAVRSAARNRDELL
jgi:hypothetical protein